MDFQKAEQEMIAGMHKMVVDYLQRKQDYAHLFTFMAYFGLYLAILFLQQGGEGSGYRMESTVTKFLTPEDSSSGDVVKEWSSTEEFGEYYGSTVIGNIFRDPVCGDGKW